MNERLVDAINFLDGRVIETDKRQQLARLRVQLADADNDGALNQIRDELAADFNGYAAGRMLFGPQISASTAEAGTYRVTLTVDGESYEGSITIRDDPMMAEHGRR
jgi:hypothetical protein